jgi:hypothetical protein
MEEVRRRYRPKAPSPAVPAGLQAQWDEMHSRGVASRGTTPYRIDGDLLRQLQAEPVTSVILDEVSSHLLPAVTNGLVAVADVQGRVLMAAGRDDARASAAEAGLTTGVVWTCLTSGVNGIGRTVRSRRGNQCFAETHWRVEQFELVCDVAPVWHRCGTRIGWSPRLTSPTGGLLRTHTPCQCSSSLSNGCGSDSSKWTATVERGNARQRTCSNGATDPRWSCRTTS